MSLSRSAAADLAETAAAFVEMTLGFPSSGPGCVRALSDARGRTLRIEWPRAAAGEVAAVARRRWEAA